jgi:hypothetical protein
MKCNRCRAGRLFLDRVFTDNMSFELACLHCGTRKYINKKTELGQWLTKRESRMARLENGLV